MSFFSLWLSLHHSTLCSVWLASCFRVEPHIDAIGLICCPVYVISFVIFVGHFLAVLYLGPSTSNTYNGSVDVYVVFIWVQYLVVLVYLMIMLCVGYDYFFEFQLVLVGLSEEITVEHSNRMMLKWNCENKVYYQKSMEEKKNIELCLIPLLIVMLVGIVVVYNLHKLRGSMWFSNSAIGCAMWWIKNDFESGDTCMNQCDLYCTVHRFDHFFLSTKFSFNEIEKSNKLKLLNEKKLN